MAVATAIVTAVVVMGGIAVASVGNNSVTSAKIRNGTVKGVDIQNGTVKSADIGNGAVTNQDLAAGIRPRAFGGRVAFNEQTVNDMGETWLNVAPVSITAGSPRSGGGFILVTATVEGRVSGDPPCEISVSLVQSGGLSGGDAAIRLNVVDTPDSTDEENATVQDLIPVAAGATVDVHIRTRVDNGPDCETPQVVSADYALSALYVPHDGNGAGDG